MLGFNAPTSPQPVLDGNGDERKAVVDSSRVEKASDKEKQEKEREGPEGKEEPVVLGVCAMDVKARSKAMREILTRLVEIEKGGVDVKLFGDMVILEEGESSERSEREAKRASGRWYCETPRARGSEAREGGGWTCLFLREAGIKASPIGARVNCLPSATNALRGNRDDGPIRGRRRTAEKTMLARVTRAQREH
jgi:hypothetical protein